ncbi:MAG: UDP-glucose 4-epimerase [Parcubacteria group bacterium Gr01-1014_44]|nr:MAG: UDP-glucose 4-epimerase [Parcubacteria group bacterium Gr01-1014_44]
MNVLVTGGLGFIGSHIVDTLVLRGDNVSVVDISTRQDTISLGAKYYRVDIRDLDLLEKVFVAEKPEYILHLAALARIQPSFEDPLAYFTTNAVGTANILTLAKKFGVLRVVYSASSSAYGDQMVPMSEDMKISSQSAHPYGSTKRMGEMLARDMGRLTNGVATVCLRYFNVYGPRQPTLTNEPYPTVIGIFFEHLARKSPMPIVPDGHQRRDFTYVSDVANANLRAMTSERVGDGEIINIGSGINYSIWDTVRLIHKLSPDFSVEDLLSRNYAVLAPERRGEMRETLSDISFAGKALGWSPKVSFEDGIEKCREFYRRQGWAV